MAAAARKVLIADDEPSIVTSLEFLMRGCGYEVRVARDGEEALRVAEGFRPDVLLLDVMMPLCDGFEVCRRIRSNSATRGVRILMLTADGRSAQAERGLAMGADACLTKPFSNKDLVDQVRGLLAASR
jgi:two-component system, OmpR family, alkaline phosphatase synthesis response regulator PhoP